MGNILGKIVIDIPALDRLMDYLEGRQQGEINSLRDKGKEALQTLRLHRTKLQESLNKEQQ